MHNKICAPEMFSDRSCDVEEPHAFVQYAADEEKEYVPLSFIFKFPPMWRDPPKSGGGWNKKYLYKVFWSPDDGDSPAEMLKRVPEIPVYENTSLTLPGYYRANVLQVAESKGELEKSLHTKRVARSGPLSTMFTSFSAGSHKDSPTLQPSDFKKAKKHTNAQAKGKKNNTAHYGNTEALRKEVVGRFGFLTSEQENSFKKKEESETVSTVEERESAAVVEPHATSSSIYNSISATKSGVKNQGNTRMKFGKNVAACEPKVISQADAPLDSVFVSSALKPQVKPDNVSSPIASMNLKVQPSKPFHGEQSGNNIKASGPPVNAEATESSEKMDDTLEIVSDSKDGSGIGSGNNDRKDSDSNSSSESDNLDLMKGKSKRKRSQRYVDSSSSSSTDGKRTKLDPDFTPRKFAAAKFELQRSESTIKRISNLNLHLQEKLIEEQTKNENLQKEIMILKANCKCKNTSSTQMITFSSDPASKIQTKRSLDFSNQTSKVSALPPVAQKPASGPRTLQTVSTNEMKTLHIIEEDCTFDNALDFCETEMKDGGDNGQLSHEDEKLTISIRDETEVASLELCEGVTLEAKFVKLLNSIPSGERKDLAFVKDMAVMAFGPEVLAASSVNGSKKGGKRDKDKAPSEPKPALNEKILSAIRTKLKERVEKEERKEIALPEDHTRLKKTRFNQIIRQVQKKVRGLGYGSGIKSNIITPEVLMGTEEI